MKCTLLYYFCLYLYWFIFLTPTVKLTNEIIINEIMLSICYCLIGKEKCVIVVSYVLLREVLIGLIIRSKILLWNYWSLDWMTYWTHTLALSLCNKNYINVGTEDLNVQDMYTVKIHMFKEKPCMRTQSLKYWTQIIHSSSLLTLLKKSHPLFGIDGIV